MRQVIAATAATLLLVAPAHADDEANRQRMMAEMRASSAASDQRNAESQQRFNQNAANNLTAMQRDNARSSGLSSSTGAAPAGARAPYSYRPSGPRSVVATYSFTVRVQETAAQAAARLQAEGAAGNAQSAFDAGRLLYTGWGNLPRDDAAARRWFAMAAQLGHPLAKAQYGNMLHEGIGGPSDRSQAMRLLREAADAGDSYGQALWGFYTLRDARSTAGPDGQAAIAMLATAAAAGELVAEGTLCTLVYQGLFEAPQDSARQAVVCRAAVGHGFLPAHVQLARMLLVGRGVAPDEAEAVRLLRTAVAGNNAEGMALLAQLQITGRGMAKDAGAGAALMKRAADAGDAGAATTFASILFAGSVPGYPRDLPTGMRYARIGADGGNADAQLMLGKGYYLGEGVPKDMHQSLTWFREAVAANGNAEAKHEVEADEGLLAQARQER